MAALPAAVRIVEVGPRDGLQNETVALDVDHRLELIGRLADTGLRDIEAGAFVSPSRVPNMAGSGELMRRLDRRPGVSYPCLVPNETGLDAALDAGCTDIAIFAAVSETFSQRNTGCSIAESMDRLARVAVRAQDAGLRVRGYLSCVMGCPYEGAVNNETVATLAADLSAMGCHEVSLGDTTGVGSPFRVRSLIDGVARRVPPERLAGHFHDTWGMAAANVHAATLAGVAVFDASVGGLGGCPFAPGATGNVATEDLVYLFDDAGVHTGVDLQKLVEVAHWISAQLDRPVASRVARAFNSRRLS
ncbi:hydroxymethylglutaryl-CoA lyase [Methyloversatilis sp.]|uniref:hydroxymethylglutaryl-CoA lyase n=1 Tax=Methyloversatilis sp. TaxID=2569862 RepID=UPI002734413C|nr:hydroxymethylglutaryl-CoA lyase [Methyloversatilis sp.]MDP2868699.1 hydroxymethylglutaryl-CoA lyase [Methyloversatilis sp.]MDP3456438.1 hydroxymethylglutaryl-CoA lyase [Methyloversatilis sp.]MDP3576712.1 hydroxymethylglutaryl-CoA lyase [Methyloversatilis sp.]